MPTRKGVQGFAGALPESRHRPDLNFRMATYVPRTPIRGTFIRRVGSIPAGPTVLACEFNGCVGGGRRDGPVVDVG